MNGTWERQKRGFSKPCYRCGELILPGRMFYRTAVAFYCRWCAGEIWGVTPPKKGQP
jgi:hypothetical protein